jgi:ABC-2 type transport system permease protein
MSLLHVNGISAVWRRQLGSLLGNPLGYIFILAFVAASALIMFWPDAYYTRNIADLGPLWDSSNWLHVGLMPVLLLILLPALAMNAWASEREQGTEELLLTMPLSITDAVFGKYLAIVTYFTIALACSLSNVVVVMWQGSPDLGLVFANYLGWWLCGLQFAALALFASVTVGMPAIAFVIGMIFCGLDLVGLTAGDWLNLGSDWFDDFNRGVVPFSHLVVAFAVVAGGLSAAVTTLASRRWRPDRPLFVHFFNALLALILVVNIGRIGQRFNVDADVSVEGLSSLSPASRALLSGVQEPITITAFISSDLPPDLALKGKEVEDKLAAVGRAGVNLTVKVLRPKDAASPAGLVASRDFGIKPHKAMKDTIVGNEPVDVFMGAAISCGSKTQVIENFDPGLSVEYELVRAVRAVTGAKKRVLGVAKTDLDIMGGAFDQASMSMTPEWDIVAEWKKQYDVQSVNLDAPIDSKIDALVVMQPSSLTQPEMERLHEWMWNGHPTLLCEDPLPYFPMAGGNHVELIPSKPKHPPANPYGGGGDETGPPKGDVKQLWTSLGIDLDENSMVWSQYLPSHQFRGQWPPTFVWVDRGAAAKDPNQSLATQGIGSLMFLFCASMTQADEKSRYFKLTFNPLITVTKGAPWGRAQFDEIMTTDFMGRLNMNRDFQPKDMESGDDQTPLPILAAEIGGRMKAVWPVTPPADAGSATAASDAKKDGLESPKDIHVIVIGDTDFANNEFFQLYRSISADTKSSDDQSEKLRFMSALRNVQFVANAVDTLMQDPDYIALRTRRPTERPLTRLATVLAKTAEIKQSATQKALDSLNDAKKDAQEAFEKKIDQVDQDAGLSQDEKDQKKEYLRKHDNATLEKQMADIGEQYTEAVNDATNTQRTQVDGYLARVRLLAICVPPALLLLLAIAVFANRLITERSHIPSARKRAT